MLCTHTPACPPATHPAHATAAPVAVHPDQGWSLLCNGVVVFEDTGELLPDARPVAPHRPEPAHGAIRGSVVVHVAGRGPVLMGRGPIWHTVPAALRALTPDDPIDTAATLYAFGYGVRP